MPARISRAVRLLIATLALALLAAPAHAADAPFATRFAQTVHGDVTAVGNTLLTCPSAVAGCTNAQGGIGATLNNNSWDMTPVNVAGGTTNSSSATVTLPAGATVLWAGLYWGADTSAGLHGIAAPTPASKGTVQFKAPGGAYQSVSAAAGDVLTSSLQATRYRAFRDVTTQVAAGGSGAYSVADVQTGTGQDRFAGWALFVAYRDDAQPIRRLNVYDGLGTVDSAHTFSTTITPFHTPATGTVTTKAGLVTFEGDASLATETATFNGQALTDALNPVNNAMNSTIESGGTRFTAKSPDYVNQFGLDLDTFSNAGALANDQSSAVLSFSSTTEYFMPSAFFLVSDEGPATSTGSGPAVGGAAQDGETLTADPGTWNGTGPLTYTYQWERCNAAGSNCQDIPGATQSTYTPTAADVGGTIRVVVTATNDAGSTSVTSAATAITAPSTPASTAPPTLPAGATKGQTLTAAPGTWTGTGPLTQTYQWERCDANGANCQAIAGATQSTYTPTAADVGGTIRVVVTTSGPGGTTSATSAPTAVTPPAPPVNTAAPTLPTTVANGQSLSAGPGAWTGSGPFSYGYQWQRCDDNGAQCVDIPGATDATYAPSSDDAGGTVRVVVTATGPGGSTSTASAPTAVVAAAGSGPLDGDLGSVPGSLVDETSCQQLVGGAKYRRTKIGGVGTVRVRAYTSGPAMKSSPVQLTTEVTGGRARSVRYLLDGRAIGAHTGARHPATLTPAQLGKVGAHTLKTTVRGRRGRAGTVVLALQTVPCQTLFTAQRWRTTAGAGLRLRIDSRTALNGLSFTVPAALLPKQTAKPRAAGFIRLYVAGRTRPVRYNLSLPGRGSRPMLLAAAGKPTVSFRRGGLRVSGLPARTAVAEVTLYRVSKLDQATPRLTYTVKASIAPASGHAETFSARPKPPR